MTMFKNALCLASCNRPWLSSRHAQCQRKEEHERPHRSWSLEWPKDDPYPFKNVVPRDRSASSKGKTL